MNINKKKIIQNIVKDTSITAVNSSLILESFLALVKKHAQINIVKISGFGSFSYKKTPKRLGRNPKTLDSYIIPNLNKLSFKPSNKIKENIN